MIILLLLIGVGVGLYMVYKKQVEIEKLLKEESKDKTE